MLRLKKRPGPVDYSKCNQTVTVYHLDKTTKAVHRTVIINAFLQHRRDNKLAKTGNTETNGFLLVVPQSSCAYLPPEAFLGAAGTYTLDNQDKVFLGVGPPASTTQDWLGLIPAKVRGLFVVNQVAPQYWQNEICHVEAS